MDIQEKDVVNLKVDVEVLKSQLTTLTKLCEKMDTVIEKLVDHQGILINQIYADMDRRKHDSDEDIKDLYKRIDNNNKELNEKLDKTEERITSKLESLAEKIQHHTDSEDRIIAVVSKYRWLIITGIIVISWLTSNVGADTILSIITK